MTLAFADRVQETSTTTGTGTYNLAGAVAGHQSFVAGIGNANTCYYTATDGVDWEVGIGTVTDASPDTLARTTIRESSNADAAVNWGAGTRNIFCTIPAFLVNSKRTIKKSGDQSVASTTLADDNDFTFALLANTKYEVDMYLDCTHTSAEDFKFDITGPASPNAVSIFPQAMYVAAAVPANCAVSDEPADAFSSAIVVQIGAGPTGIGLRIKVYIDNGANAGTFQFRWANSTTATSRTVKARSWMKYEIVH